MFNICNICLTNEINDELECTTCYKSICTHCFKNLYELCIINDNVLVNIRCPYCRNTNKCNLFEDITPETSIKIMKEYMIKSVYRYNQYEILMNENKRMENIIEDMAIKLNDINEIKSEHNDNIDINNFEEELEVF